ncbi:MAG: hypothetical protein JRD93_10425 [Deltaproteobacteria bacterium]|nr:hypothetical protein [Deltaproteobacteria bacterium]
MRKIINTITIIICVCVIFLLLGFGGEYQRAYFGKETGNSLLTYEIVIIGFTCLSVYSKRKGKDHIARSFLFISISILCFLIGWHSSPLRVYERAHERVDDLELQSIDLQSQLATTTSPKDKKQISIYLSRLNTELTARRSELAAAKIRYSGDPEYFKNKFNMYVWWFFSVATLLLTILHFIEYLRAKRKEGGL